MDVYKRRGLVSKVLNPQTLRSFTGNVGIGHVCYGSKKRLNINNAQPYHFKSEKLQFSLAFNGVITNHKEMNLKLGKMGRIFAGDSDVELIATLIETFSKYSENMLDALRLVMKALKGSFSLVLLENTGEIYAMRDPIEYKPLCLGKLKVEDKKFYIISSESCSIDVLGGYLKDDIKPGEIISINPVSGVK